MTLPLPADDGGVRAWTAFSTPARCGASPREQRWIERATHFQLALPRAPLDPAGATVVGYEWGAGPTVVCAHGWESRASQLTAFVPHLLERGLRVVAFDAPAHGTAPGERSNVLELAAALDAVLARVGPPRAILAHSLGAAAAVMLVAEGRAVERLALVAPLVSLEDEVADFIRRRGFAQREHAGLRTQLTRHLGEDLFRRTSLVEVAPRVAAPTLIAHDELDPRVPFEACRALAGALPDAQLFPTRGLGHAALLRMPEVVARVADHLAG